MDSLTLLHIARMYQVATIRDPSHHLEKTFDVGHDHDELILVSIDIHYVSTTFSVHWRSACGLQSANGRITGLSKLARASRWLC